jgi:hypothetical protein
MSWSACLGAFASDRWAGIFISLCPSETKQINSIHLSRAVRDALILPVHGKAKHAGGS